jgi:hypothetical protein
MGAALMAGCGGGTPAPPPPVVTPSNLGGNWLLYGAFPKAIGSSSNPPGMAASFDVIGSNIVASAGVNTTCGGAGFTGTFGEVLRGTVAADGSFSVAMPQSTGAPPFGTLTISGKVPSSASAAWTGSYSLTSSMGCTFTQTGSFSATPVQDVSGMYTGTGSLLIASGPGNPASVPITLSLTLQQGAPLYGPTGPTPLSSRLGIAGSIQVQGFSCFSKGTTSMTTGSGVEGGPVLLSFVMDDGSAVTVLGSIDDVAASTLDIDLFQVMSGSCSGLYSFGLDPLVVHR